MQHWSISDGMANKRQHPFLLPFNQKKKPNQKNLWTLEIAIIKKKLPLGMVAKNASN